jgi:uncharacterized Zn finger protein
MNFPAFETQIERKILDRGFDYYENNNVIDVENLGNGEFSAIVEGSENYEVFVEISKGKVVEHSCDCPYYWGDVCKHVVAVLYYIRDTEILGESTDKEGVKSQLQLIIVDISEQDLRDYVLFYALRNRQFREDFTEEFG